MSDNNSTKKTTIDWKVEATAVDYKREIGRVVTWADDNSGITVHECYIIRDDKGKVTEREVIASVTLNVNDLPKEQQVNCTLHGLSQKTCDKTASMSYDKGFKVGERLEVVAGVYDGLKDNVWSNRAASTSSLTKEQKAEAKMLLGKKYEVMLQIAKGELPEAVIPHMILAFDIKEAELEQVKKSLEQSKSK